MGVGRDLGVEKSPLCRILCLTPLGKQLFDMNKPIGNDGAGPR